MIFQLGINITTKYGNSAAQNFDAVSQGRSALSYYENLWDIPEAFWASIIENEQIDDWFSDITSFTNLSYSSLEKLAIISASDAIEKANIDPSREDVLFILSTTKGNVENLSSENVGKTIYLWHSAQIIAQYFGNINRPLVVSNACISGCAAQLEALRRLQNTKYRFAVVIGVDRLSKFIVSGFQSFKALSPNPCKPFDANRTGLNLGEGAATIVYGIENPQYPCCALRAGSIHNDANHISAPSRTAEGLYRAIKDVLPLDCNNLAFVNAHGTATLFNDDMESVALNRTGLKNVPTQSLKAYFGHTLGAAGLIETVISSQALLQNTVLKSLGTEKVGTVEPIQVCLHNESTEKTEYIKVMSGFGGCNVALVFQKR